MDLKILRKNKAVTQEEVAKYLNVAPSTYRGYEANTSEPNIETMIKLANYFDVSLDYLCGRQFNNQVGYIPEDRKELVKLILKLKDEDVNKILGYASALIDEK